MKSIVLFGDSLTQGGWAPGGWAARLADRYVRRADVFNRGFSGYNTRWAVGVLDTVFGPGAAPFDLKQSLVTVFFGANDSAMPPHNIRQHVPLEEYTAHLKTIVEHLKDRGATVVVIAPPPVVPQKWAEYLTEQAGGDMVPEDRDNEVTKGYAAAAMTVASECGVAGIDLWHGLQKALPGDGWQLSLYDGLHMGPMAADVLCELLVDTIATSVTQA